MRSPKKTWPGVGALVCAVAVGACGSSATTTTTTPPESLAVTASKNLSLMLQITRTGKLECRMETYNTTLANGQPSSESVHLCSAPPAPGDPVLIQSPRSRQSMVVDITASGCGAVDGGTKAGALSPLPTKCTTAAPRFRVTTIPHAGRVLITGIPDVPVINFGRHLCHSPICITPLA